MVEASSGGLTDASGWAIHPLARIGLAASRSGVRGGSDTGYGSIGARVVGAVSRVVLPFWMRVGHGNRCSALRFWATIAYETYQSDLGSAYGNHSGTVSI